MSIRAVVFDLDGTLADTLPDIARTMDGCLARLGLPGHDLAAYRSFVGHGVVALVQRVLPPGRPDLVADLVATYRQAYEAECCAAARPYPGVTALLAALRARGLPLAVLSNKPDGATHRVVDHLFAPGTFAHVLGQAEGAPLKPDPTTLLAQYQETGFPERGGPIPGKYLFYGSCFL